MGFVEPEPETKDVVVEPQTEERNNDGQAAEEVGSGGPSSGRPTAEELPEPRPYATKTIETVKHLKAKYRKKAKRRRRW